MVAPLGAGMVADPMVTPPGAGGAEAGALVVR